MGFSSSEVFPTNVLSIPSCPYPFRSCDNDLSVAAHQLLAPKHPTSQSLRGEVARPSSYLLRIKEREKVERGRKPSGEPHWWWRRQGPHHPPLPFLSFPFLQKLSVRAAQCTTYFLEKLVTLKMTGRGKGGKGLGKSGAKRHRKLSPPNFNKNNRPFSGPPNIFTYIYSLYIYIHTLLLQKIQQDQLVNLSIHLFIFYEKKKKHKLPRYYWFLY